MADDPIEIKPQEATIKLKHCRTPVHVTVPFGFVHTDLNNWGSEIKAAIENFISKIPPDILSFIQKVIFAFTGETLQTAANAIIDGLIAAAKQLKPKHMATFTAVKCCPASDCEITGELEPDTPITVGGIELKPSWTTHDPGSDTVPCECSDHTKGEQKEQVFTCTWTLTISISAWGISYSLPVHVVDFRVLSPCCCENGKEDPTPDKAQENDKGSNQKNSKKNSKKKNGK